MCQNKDFNTLLIYEVCSVSHSNTGRAIFHKMETNFIRYDNKLPLTYNNMIMRHKLAMCRKLHEHAGLVYWILWEQ